MGCRDDVAFIRNLERCEPVHFERCESSHLEQGEALHLEHDESVHLERDCTGERRDEDVPGRDVHPALPPADCVFAHLPALPT